MNKAELILAVAEQTGFPRKDVDVVLAAAFMAMQQALSQEEKVQIASFGSFEIKKRPERVGRNPKTQAEILLPATRIPTFKPAKALKDAVEFER